MTAVSRTLAPAPLASLQEYLDAGGGRAGKMEWWGVMAVPHYAVAVIEASPKEVILSCRMAPRSEEAAFGRGGKIDIAGLTQ